MSDMPDDFHVDLNYEPKWFDREGTPVTMERWVELRQRGWEYIVLAKTWVGDLEVSTVWLGLNHQFGDGPPLIFETMIFDRARVDAMGFQARYSTEQQARDGHDEAVDRLQRGVEL